MEVIVLLGFVSIVLVTSSLLALVASLKQGDHDHVDRLALAPLADDEGVK